MSQGDERGYGGEPGVRPEDAYSTIGGTRQTRTRLPGGDDTDGYGRRPVRNTRSLVLVVGVVVLLLAAIAIANLGDGTDKGSGGGGGKESSAAGAGPTAATGTKPVEGKNGTIASGFAHDEQGAQSAAANYAVALGSAEMFSRESRHAIVKALYTPKAAALLIGPQDSAYSEVFLAKLGLDPEGNAPHGSTFVSRTIPIGTKIVSYSEESATIDVWYTGLIGMSGEGSTDPVSTSWKTWTADLAWVDGDWKITSDKQKDGPAPVPGDVPASSSDEISEAVEGFGGFTYAR